MQNVYDIAHELVRSLKETDQYKDYNRDFIRKAGLEFSYAAVGAELKKIYESV